MDLLRRQISLHTQGKSTASKTVLRVLSGGKNGKNPAQGSQLYASFEFAIA
jgi:hypothetical protein